MTGHEVLTETLAGISLAADAQSIRSAARLRGAVDHLNDDRGLNRSSRWLEFGGLMEQPLIEAVGAEDYASEHALGAALSRDDAIALAQSLLIRPSDIP